MTRNSLPPITHPVKWGMKLARVRSLHVRYHAASLIWWDNFEREPAHAASWRVFKAKFCDKHKFDNPATHEELEAALLEFGYRNAKDRAARRRG